jgi:hypothetical protein
MLNNKSWVERNFSKQYLNILHKHIMKLSLGKKKEICQEIERDADILAKENNAMVVDKASRTHLGMTALVLASYRVLMSRIGDSEKVVNILENTFKAVGQRWIKLYITLMLLLSRDPFKKMIQMSKKRVINNYGKTFEFEYSGDGLNDFTIATKKCFYKDFFDSYGIPVLTRVFCSGDENWFNEIKPDKHGFRFERPTTLGYGGSECPFTFTRVKKD